MAAGERMGSLPYLSELGNRRYDVNQWGDIQPGDGFPWKLDMRPLLPKLAVTLRRLSNVAKLDDNGVPEMKWRYELPPMPLMAALVAPYHIRGSAPVDQFPYSLKAVGLVDPAKIAAGGKGLVTDNFQIIP